MGEWLNDKRHGHGMFT
jgi:hypothetical protein